MPPCRAFVGASLALGSSAVTVAPAAERIADLRHKVALLADHWKVLPRHRRAHTSSSSSSEQEGKQTLVQQPVAQPPAVQQDAIQENEHAGQLERQQSGAGEQHAVLVPTSDAVQDDSLTKQDGPRTV
ncbi:unnamed protein product, partial [Amoebophrya sp. A25]|eukprot:GSA25T00011370001.1